MLDKIWKIFSNCRRHKDLDHIEYVVVIVLAQSIRPVHVHLKRRQAYLLDPHVPSSNKHLDYAREISNARSAWR